MFEALTDYAECADELATMSEERKMTFLQNQLEGLQRPQTRRDQIERLFNLITEVSQPFDHKRIMGKNLVKQLTKVPRRKPKILVDIAALMSWWRGKSAAERWTQLRNDAILFYILATGRRASNAKRALMPEIVVRGVAILNDELKAKRDDLCHGRRVLIWRSSDKAVCPVRIIQKYLDHETTQKLVNEWTGPKESCPLFFGCEGVQPAPTTLSKDRCRNIVTQALRSAGCLKDNLGRALTQKAIRATQWTRAEAARVDSEFVRVMQARKPTKSETNAYLGDSTFVGYTDLMLQVSDECDMKSVVNINTAQQIYEREQSEIAKQAPARRSTRARTPTARTRLGVADQNSLLI